VGIILVLLWILGLGLLALVYFIPAIVALKRRHHNRTAIFALNFFAGWTVLGWIGAFVWSPTSPPPGR
jgi:hypothetical protein